MADKAPLRLAVALDEFYAMCLLLYGKPIDIPTYSRARYYAELRDKLNNTEHGRKFTHCVTACGGKKYKVMELHTMYVKWYVAANRRVDNVIAATMGDRSIKADPSQPSVRTEERTIQLGQAEEPIR